MNCAFSVAPRWIAGEIKARCHVYPSGHGRSYERGGCVLGRFFPDSQAGKLRQSMKQRCRLR